MSSVIDGSVVGILVLGALAYVTTTLGPRSWRGRLLAALAWVLDRTPSMFGLRALARRLNDQAAAKAGGACGGCDTCGTASDSGNRAATPTPGGSNEVRIPLSRIRKRG